jgi:outer membrane protein
MKRITIIANIVLAVAVVVLYVLHFTANCTKKARGVINTEAAIDLPAGSIVYIQIDSLVNELDMFHALKGVLEAKVKVIDDDLTKKGRTFERDYNDFMEKIQKGLLTRSQGEAQQAQLEARQRDLQQYSQQKQMEIQEEEQVMLNNVINEIRTFLSVYNQEYNFSLIFSTSGNPGTIVIGNAALDITKDVITGLNAKYANQVGKKK